MAPHANGSAGKRGSCSHLHASESNLHKYTIGLKWGRKVKRGEVRRDEGEEDESSRDRSYSYRHEETKRQKLLPYPSCAICQTALHRPFVCLECALPACFYTRIEGVQDCVHQHLEQSKHHIAFNLFDGTLFCSQCDAIVSDIAFRDVLAKEKNRSRDKAGRLISSSLIKDNAEAGPSICRVPRGLYNLGASCFMNVILQSFVQNPLLRNYFLSDRHHAALCPARENCLACELDKLFTEFFSEKPQVAPYAPTNFLFCIYLARESTEVSSGAGEHDAHELFISALNNIHAALMAVGREPSTRSERLPMYPFGDQAYGLAASRSGTASNASDDGVETSEHPGGRGPGRKTFSFNSDIMCPCVVHRTFAGVLQSDVTCQRCGWMSTAHDPFLDLSLDLRTNGDRSASLLADANFDPTKKKSKKQKEREEKEKRERLLRESSGVDDESTAQSLRDCLTRYCALEKLEKSDYSCQQCGIGSTAVKQLSLCRLPPVLCFQLKRFEHNSTTGTKIESRVKFPLTFDVREFCTSATRPDDEEDDEDAYGRHRDDEMGDEEGGGRQHRRGIDQDSYLYDLFTVIVHEGKLNTGHYYCYFKWRESWYIANDDSLRPAKLQDVLACKAYQLCYLRRGLQNVRA